MTNELKTSETAEIFKDLITNAEHKEASIFWTDPTTDILLKGRLDVIVNKNVIVDLKTATCASKEFFHRKIHDFGYHRQAAMYIDGLSKISKIDANEIAFIFAVVEKKPPYLHSYFQIDDNAINEGRKEYKNHLMKYKSCLAKDEWPGYSTKIEPISIPYWAFEEN